MRGRLDGKVALVTGASRGIGKATALVFAREGAAVVVNYSKSRELARQVVDEIRKAGRQAIAIQADVARKAEVVAMVETTMREFGKIDVLVNNAGILSPGNILTLREESLDEMIAVNVKGVIHCAQAVAPHMIERRYGKIVNVASLAALGTAMADTTPYAATKAAVISLTKRLALELGVYGINVNAICPGFIRTDMLMSSGTPEEVEVRLASLAKKAVLGRVGEGEDIAYSALFLASDEAGFVTAQALTVDGGRMDFLSHSG
ncbi:MAG: glucose 1-dehydrogenase [Candidatus Rokubacteria bacterium]|nr:glucose 1-dehydrogenase [Candidatus Rokubacteria bacterium]